MASFLNNYYNVLDWENNPSDSSDVDDDDDIPGIPSNQYNKPNAYNEKLLRFFNNVEELGPDEYYCIIHINVMDDTIKLENCQALKAYLHSRSISYLLPALSEPALERRKTFFKDKSSIIEFIDKWKKSPIASLMGKFMNYKMHNTVLSLVKFRMPLEPGITLTPAKIMDDFNACDIDKLREKHQYRGQVYQLDHTTLKKNQLKVMANPNIFFSRLPHDVINEIMLYHSPGLITPQITIQAIFEIPDPYDIEPLTFDYRSTKQEQQADNEITEQSLELKPPSEVSPPRFKK